MSKLMFFKNNKMMIGTGSPILLDNEMKGMGNTTNVLIEDLKENLMVGSGVNNNIVLHNPINNIKRKPIKLVL
jgi:hypothetical protein